MKFCYVDESGTGDEPFAVMVGIVVDTARMRVTKAEWEQVLADLGTFANRPVKELHTRDFYAGNGAWRDVDGKTRARTIGAIFDWLCARKHDVVFTAVEKSLFYASLPVDKRLEGDVKTLWRYLGLHLALSVQKNFQKQKNNKGNTVLILDNEEKEEMRFTSLLLDPPAWTDSYYSRGKKQDSFDQPVDAPYFADSTHVPMLQVADFVAYFFRRYCELEACGSERYMGEREQVAGWVKKALGRALPRSAIFPKTGRCACGDLYFQMAPSCLRDQF
jgi:hypothetical protein